MIKVRAWISSAKVLNDGAGHSFTYDAEGRAITETGGNNGTIRPMTVVTTMKDGLLALASLIVGGLAFWISEVIVLHLVVSESAWLPASLVGPMILVAFYFVTARQRRKNSVGPSSALFAIVGVWSTAPWLMLLSASLQTPGMLKHMRFIDYAYLCLMSICPALTLWTAAMDGTAYGLILVTITMPICHSMLEKERWLIPPSARRFMHLNRGYPRN
jgi:uncharacterized membrane protein